LRKFDGLDESRKIIFCLFIVYGEPAFAAEKGFNRVPDWSGFGFAVFDEVGEALIS